MTIFGLGNPTERYAYTRHNIGFMTVDVIARRLKLRFHHLPGRFLARTRYEDTDLILVKPLLYMNNSGIVVKEQLTLHPDDLALPFGQLRIRPRGSDGGHKGLASIIYHLGRDNFPRIRIGIGSPPDGDAVDYVLSPFTAEEQRLLPAILHRAADACLSVITRGLEWTMSQFNPTPPNQTANTMPAAEKK